MVVQPGGDIERKKTKKLGRREKLSIIFGDAKTAAGKAPPGLKIEAFLLPPKNT